MWYFGSSVYSKTKCNRGVESMIQHMGPFQLSVESGGRMTWRREVLIGFNIVEG